MRQEYTVKRRPDRRHTLRCFGNRAWAQPITVVYLESPTIWELSGGMTRLGNTGRITSKLRARTPTIMARPRPRPTTLLPSRPASRRFRRGRSALAVRTRCRCGGVWGWSPWSPGSPAYMILSPRSFASSMGALLFSVASRMFPALI